jgi:Domain of unknown function (DUF1840)
MSCRQFHKGFLMLYKFKSKFASDLIMLQPNGEQLLKLIGKDAGPTGVILSAAMPEAIAALKAAVAAQEALQAEQAEQDITAQDASAVGLRQRTAPFIEMLERNHQAGGDVVWGV